MKKFTRVVLLSSAIVFPIKIGFPAPKESGAGERRKSNGVERVENILARLQSGLATVEPPSPDLDAKSGIGIASLPTDPSPPIPQSITSEGSTNPDATQTPPSSIQTSPHDATPATAESPGPETIPPVAPETSGRIAADDPSSSTNSVKTASLPIESAGSIAPSTTTERPVDAVAIQEPSAPKDTALETPPTASDQPPVVSPKEEPLIHPSAFPSEVEIKTQILALDVEEPSGPSDIMALGSVLTLRAAELPATDILALGMGSEPSSAPNPAAPSPALADQNPAKPSVSPQEIPVLPSNELPPTIAAPQETAPIVILTPTAQPVMPTPANGRNKVQPAEVPKAASPQPAQAEPRKVRVRLTFYSGQDDQWGSRVAWGKVAKAERGRTAAADPAVFPYGTWIEVPGFGKLRVEDTGSAVKSRKASDGKEPVIDIYVGDEREAMRLAGSTPDYVEITLL